MITQYEEIAEKILQADAILIGASNGLSITEGLNLFADDEAFESLLGDYKRKYGFSITGRQRKKNGDISAG